jgi:hypothetical protein
LGGSVVPVAMPDGATFNYTRSRAVDAEGNIAIEGIGVPPTVRVPVTEDTVFSERDVLMDAALAYIASQRGEAPAAKDPDAPIGETTDGGEIVVGQSATGTLSAGGAVRYTLNATGGLTLDIAALGEGDVARGLVVRLYLPNDNRPLDESYSLIPGEPGAGFLNMNIPVDMPLVIEVQAVAPTLTGSFTLTITESP